MVNVFANDDYFLEKMIFGKFDLAKPLSCVKNTT